VQILKILGLGTLFFLLISIALTAFFGSTTGGAVALSAVKAGAVEALYSPYLWLTVVIAYGAAIWLVKRHA